MFVYTNKRIPCQSTWPTWRVLESSYFSSQLFKSWFDRIKIFYYFSYCDPRFNFPTQDESIDMAIYILQQKKKALQADGKTFSSVLIVCGTYTIGNDISFNYFFVVIIHSWPVIKVWFIKYMWFLFSLIMSIYFLY